MVKSKLVFSDEELKDIMKEHGLTRTRAEAMLRIKTRLDLSEEEALQVVMDDKIIDDGGKAPFEEKIPTVKKPAPKKKKGSAISDEEVEGLFEIIVQEIGPDEAFQNKHISGKAEEKLGLTSRQTPHRISRLVSSGKLVEVDKSEVKLPGKTTAKAYKIAEGVL